MDQERGKKVLTSLKFKNLRTLVDQSKLLEQEYEMAILSHKNICSDSTLLASFMFVSCVIKRRIRLNTPLHCRGDDDMEASLLWSIGERKWEGATLGGFINKSKTL